MKAPISSRCIATFMLASKMHLSQSTMPCVLMKLVLIGYQKSLKVQSIDKARSCALTASAAL